MAIKLGTGPREVHYNAGIHANEWITSALLMQFVADCVHAMRNENYADELHKDDATINGAELISLFKQKSLWLVPMLNPDGVDLAQEGVNGNHPLCKLLLNMNEGSADFTRWKANIRGVDLNDQFPAHWGNELARRAVSQPGPYNYSGEAPLTEPEAKAIADFTNNHFFQLVIALHTQGEEIYWNYRDMEPALSLELANEFAEVSGYQAVKLYDSDAGYKDWFIQEFRRPGFTIEAGLGINPLPMDQFNEIYDKVSRILLLGLEKA
jgi:g-D-glutamyl-meso-diaminopimelate peptidase